MAGSLNHIVEDDGSFSMDTIENMGDAYEALEDCFDIIACLLEDLGDGARESLERACERSLSPMPATLPRFGARYRDE